MRRDVSTLSPASLLALKTIYSSEEGGGEPPLPTHIRGEAHTVAVGWIDRKTTNNRNLSIALNTSYLIKHGHKCRDKCEQDRR